jgi:hypothetical protein
MRTPETAWLDGVRAGDELALCFGWARDDHRIVVVSKVTATQIVVGTPPNDRRYRKRDGRAIGDHFYRHRLVPLTDEIRRQIARNEARQVLRYARWEDLLTDDLIKICQLYEASVPK